MSQIYKCNYCLQKYLENYSNYKKVVYERVPDSDKRKYEEKNCGVCNKLFHNKYGIIVIGEE